MRWLRRREAVADLPQGHPLIAGAASLQTRLAAEDVPEDYHYVSLSTPDRLSEGLISTFLNGAKAIQSVSIGALALMPVIALSPLTKVVPSLRNPLYSAAAAAIGEMGPTAIKALQWSSTRPDLFPEEFCTRMTRFQKRAHPDAFPFVLVPLGAALQSAGMKHLIVSPYALGSGSVAQVHPLLFPAPGGGYQSVVGKVLRPQVQGRIRADLIFMSGVARLMTRIVGNTRAQFLPLVQGVESFSRIMSPQTNLLLEGKNLTKFRKNFAQRKTAFGKIHIPTIMEELSLPEVLIESREYGLQFENWRHLMDIDGMQRWKLLPSRKRVSQPAAQNEGGRLASLVGISASFAGFLDNCSAIFRSASPPLATHTSLCASPSYLSPSPLKAGKAHCDGFPKVYRRQLTERGWNPFNRNQNGASGQHSWFSRAKLNLPQKLARLGADTFLQMLIVDNFVHADLHPGNLLLRHSDSTGLELVLLDAGLTTSLPARDRLNFLDLLRAVAFGQGRLAGELMLTRARRQACPDPEAFYQAVNEIVQKHVGPPLKDTAVVTNHGRFTVRNLNMGEALKGMLRVSLMHRVELDPAFVGVILATTLAEGIGSELDPDLNLLDAAKPFLNSIVAEKMRGVR